VATLVELKTARMLVVRGARYPLLVVYAHKIGGVLQKMEIFRKGKRP
jgi:hypothetical protein